MKSELTAPRSYRPRRYAVWLSVFIAYGCTADTHLNATSLLTEVSAGQNDGVWTVGETLTLDFKRIARLYDGNISPEDFDIDPPQALLPNRLTFSGDEPTWMVASATPFSIRFRGSDSAVWRGEGVCPSEDVLVPLKLASVRHDNVNIGPGKYVVIDEEPIVAIEGRMHILGCTELAMPQAMVVQLELGAMLQVHGSAEAPVLFHAASPSLGWGGIKAWVDDTEPDDGLHLDYCSLEDVYSSPYNREAALTITQVSEQAVAVSASVLRGVSVTAHSHGQDALKLTGFRARTQQLWRDNVLVSAGGYGLVTDLSSFSTAPHGQYVGHPDNPAPICLQGGDLVAGGQMWANPGAPVFIDETLNVWPHQRSPSQTGHHYDSLFIGGSSLTLLPGLELRFAKDAGFFVGASFEQEMPIAALSDLNVQPIRDYPWVRLHVFGRRDNPVILTSASVNPRPGDWKGLHFGIGARVQRHPWEINGDGTVLSALQHMDIRYAGQRLMEQSTIDLVRTIEPFSVGCLSYSHPLVVGGDIRPILNHVRLIECTGLTLIGGEKGGLDPWLNLAALSRDSCRCSELELITREEDLAADVPATQLTLHSRSLESGYFPTCDRCDLDDL